MTIYITELIILVFLAIVFLESSFDKIINWKENIKWLKSHFSKTIIKGKIKFLLSIILLLEIITGVLALLAIFSIIITNLYILRFKLILF